MTATANRPRAPRRPRVPGPSRGPWLAILLRCLASCGAATALAAAVAAAVSGGPAAASVALGAAVVAGFFGLSLLVGHLVGRRNPSAALGAFMGGYLLKVVVLGVLAFTFDAPAWLDGRWFPGAAIGAVVLWQAVELSAFSRLRFQLYTDPAEPAPGSAGSPA